MLNRDELSKITKIKGNDKYYVSCFLNVDPVTNAKGDYAIHIKNMLKRAYESQGKDIRKKIKPDMEKIEAYFFSNRRNLKKGLAILSCSEADYWEEFHLSVNIKNDVIVDKTPYIKPLINIIDKHRQYAVMLIDKESARLFTVHLGEIAEYRELFTENVPGKHKKGGWFSLAEKSFERHIDYHVNLHIKDAVRQLEQMLSSGDISRLLLGGAEEAVTKTKGFLSRPISEKVIGHFSMQISASMQEVLAKAEPLLEKYEQAEKDAMVDELLTRTSKKESAVLGLDNVLSALQEGRIMKLLLVKDYRASGYACEKCGFLTSQVIDNCPYCKDKADKVDYIVDLAIQRSLEQGAEIEVISGNEQLEKTGSIGAILRY